MQRVVALFLLSGILALFLACSKDEAPVPSGPGGGGATGVSFVPAEMPYQTLSSYRFFTGNLKDLEPNTGVLPYDVITPLFSDYAHKKRFVWMAPGAQAAYAGDHAPLDFDDGTVLIKNFYYDQVAPDLTTRIVETRLMYRIGGEWHFANYVWNSEQTEAVLDLQGSITPVTWTDEQGQTRSINYRIPSGAECLTCHKRTTGGPVPVALPIGPKPQNLNKPYLYPEGPMGQLQRWQQEGYLGGVPGEIVTTVDWSDPGQDLATRVRSYLDMNCAHCHSADRHCDYRPMRFAFNQTIDPVDLGVCVEPHEVPDPVLIYIVARGNSERSVMHFRMNTNAENLRMPLLGRTIVHEEGVALVEEWINSLTPPCN